ncbi:VanZ family protein [Xylanibacillus composti]|uniref:Antibiotic resistance protein VanZ n=1 Tax=Xylanibacillus composti TaxID=1572762 RepID=A0A8J4H3R5_9BACL|nr:VanZ family protein [Xylanibacillus composti]GIQ68123.1 antibiotic resistance protein VanZ [Xylanibacillus composti]
MRLFIDIFTFFVGPTLLAYLLIRLSLIKWFKVRVVKDALILLFVAYVAFVLFIVWFDRSIPTDYLLFNLVPFYTLYEYFSRGFNHIAVVNILGNLIMTLPFGMFAYFKINVIPKLNIFWYSLCIPIIIELGQLVIYMSGYGMRSVDIDDIILNSAGILIGYFIVNSCFKRFHWNQERILRWIY